MEKTGKPFIWNGINLDEKRHIMDAPADEAVMSIYTSGAMSTLRSLLVDDMASNSSPVSEELPKVMFDFLKSELQHPFTEEDIAYFTKTHAIWKEKGMKFVYILLFRALPYTYMAEKPANVLKMTKLLIEQPERRIFETAQFVFDVMEEKWWEPDKRGLLTALKVRIMHASMRHLLLSGSDGSQWNNDWGKPISQEDLVATNHVFSLEFFKGMKLLGDELTAEEQEAWFHTWITIGKIMGIQQDLVCKNVDEAWELQHMIYEHLFNDPTEAGIPLAKALVGLMVHFHLPEELTLLMMKKMLEDDQFPDCYNRMLGPSYREAYPGLFTNPVTQEEKEQDRLALNKRFHFHVKNYHDSLLLVKEKYNKLKNEKKGFLGWIARLINWIIGEGKKVQLFEDHLKQLHDLLYKEGTDIPVDELEEDAIVDIMSTMGGIMVAILSLYFRPGKQSGFRIPDDLQQLWALK